MRRTVGRAWRDTVGTVLHGGWAPAIFALVAFLVGLGSHYFLYGWVAAVDELVVWLSFGLAGIGGAAVLFFFWNLAAAPYRNELDDKRAVQRELAAAETERAELETRIAERDAAPLMPLMEFRDQAVQHGWHFHANDGGALFEFVRLLREAAVAGTIPFYGRLYEYDLGGADKDDSPRVEMPRDHFREFSIDILRFLMADDNYSLRSSKTGEFDHDQRGKAYIDLHVHAELARRWLEVTPVKADSESTT